MVRPVRVGDPSYRHRPRRPQDPCFLGQRSLRLPYRSFLWRSPDRTLQLEESYHERLKLHYGIPYHRVSSTCSSTIFSLFRSNLTARSPLALFSSVTVTTETWKLPTTVRARLASSLSSLVDGKPRTLARSSTASLPLAFSIISSFFTCPETDDAPSSLSCLLPRGVVKTPSGQDVWELAGRWTSQLVARKAGAGHGDLQPDDKVNASAKEYLVRPHLLLSLVHLISLTDARLRCWVHFSVAMEERTQARRSL
jgi:hypothetical protein